MLLYSADVSGGGVKFVEGNKMLGIICEVNDLSLTLASGKGVTDRHVQKRTNRTKRTKRQNIEKITKNRTNGI